MRQLRALIVIVLLAASGSAATGGYTVRWGDTLSGIGRRFGVTPKTIASANGIVDPNRIVAGRVLTLPDGGGSGGASGSSPTGATAGVFHVVRAGENLATIARKFGTTSSALVEANGLKNPNHLVEGQRLLIPNQQWFCPVRGSVVSPVHNFHAPRPGGRQHQGNDIFAAEGTPVVAPVGGVLRHVRGNIAGNAFYLAGDDGTTYYGAHLASYVAGPGRVGAGNVIGRVGATGNADGHDPHLHFEVHPNGGAAVDPWPLVSRAS
jgi:murein DD-endopeptidase MepM/ murein hydrolase activator NlpD